MQGNDTHTATESQSFDAADAAFALDIQIFRSESSGSLMAGWRLPATASPWASALTESGLTALAA
ncbi:hypothetical protein LNV23_20030 [Paucibacter sp. DJ1R-11]|uniref:hypothetical protein n=1 Tax=Paucibacter sp. DJ1R-11 TaxID=2893556 RepID=UPI0021E3DEB5|nr:hypothetical protein [Paucibacter sp. DJ1R-11]MCV2365743.1 hypothetical protein [Paucibacter sp. DJ1R-11]